MRKILAALVVSVALTAPVVVADAAQARDTNWPCPHC